MGSDLYSITVVARGEDSVDLKVDIVNTDVVDIPLSPSFAAMVIEDEWAPGAAAYKAWWRAWADRDPWADPSKLYRRIELLELHHLPRAQSRPPPGMTMDEWDALDSIRDDGGRSLLGSGTLRVTVDDPGYLGHLEPGTSWGSTAYDERGEGPTALGATDEPRAWER